MTTPPPPLPFSPPSVERCGGGAREGEGAVGAGPPPGPCIGAVGATLPRNNRTGNR